MFSSIMIRKLFKVTLAVATGTVIGFHSANAAPKPQNIGVFKDWAAYTYQSGKGKVCYIVSQPIDTNPKGLNRDPAFFLVTHRPADGVRNEVHTIIGYPFRKSSTAALTIDNASGFKLITVGDGAWAGTKESDNKVVRAMQAGNKMVIQGRSARGTLTTDKYSLAGVSAALKKIGQECR